MENPTVGRLAVLIALAACHGPALPAIPGKGGPAWIEVQSEHFTVWTDASRGKAMELVRKMEHLRQVIIGVGFTGTRMEGRSIVFALRDSEEVGVFVPEQFVAYAFYGGALNQSGIVIPADADDNTVITHEIVHVISYAAIRNQPAWFAEGLAGFFETVNVDPERASGDVGQPNPNIVGQLRARPPMKIGAAFACTAYSCMDSNFYATSWALFAYLANTYPKELLAFAKRIDELPENAWQQAWTEAFPQLTAEKLDHEVRKWLSYGKHTVWKFRVELGQWPVTERPLTDADVLATRAALRQRFAKPGAPKPPELAEALALDPTHLIANLISAEYDQTIDLALAKRVAEAHSDDWRGWWLVGLSQKWQGPEANAAWERACALPGAPSWWCRPSN